MPKRGFDDAELAKMKTVLKSLPKKEREKKRLSTSELVKAIRGDIRAAMARGYTLDEVITALNNEGSFDLKMMSIKRYMTETQKKRTTSTIAGKFSGNKSEDALQEKKRVVAVDLPAADEL
jgi:hypothetical protein